MYIIQIWQFFQRKFCTKQIINVNLDYKLQTHSIAVIYYNFFEYNKV